MPRAISLPTAAIVRLNEYGERGGSATFASEGVYAHGTAIISGAGLLNAAQLAHKQLDQIKMVVSGAGAAAIVSTGQCSA